MGQPEKTLRTEPDAKQPGNAACHAAVTRARRHRGRTDTAGPPASRAPSLRRRGRGRARTTSARASPRGQPAPRGMTRTRRAPPAIRPPPGSLLSDIIHLMSDKRRQAHGGRRERATESVATDAGGATDVAPTDGAGVIDAPASGLATAATAAAADVAPIAGNDPGEVGVAAPARLGASR